MDNVTPQMLMHLFVCGAQRVKEHVDILTHIDSRFGDGDHGITMSRIADCIVATATPQKAGNLREALEDMGTRIMALNCGASGPLWGTLIGGLAGPLANAGPGFPIDAALLKSMLAASLDEMLDVSSARVGNKTMMDTLIPAVEAAQQVPDGTGVKAVLHALAKAGRQGAEATEGFVPLFGRAKNYKEATLGTQDAGAVSMACFFEGMAEGLDA